MSLSITSYRNIKMALIAAHLNAEVILVVTGTAGEFSYPGSAFFLAVISVSFPSQCYRSSMQKNPVSGISLRKVHVAG